MNINKIIQNHEDFLLRDVTIRGWVRSFRNNIFISINDGSSINNLQIVVNSDFSEDILNDIKVGASIEIEGSVVKSEGSGQNIEISAKTITILGKCNDLTGTILQPKRHSLEKLREQAHLRFRTNTFSAIFRIRNKVSFAIHKYFNENDFCYINTPIITGSDAEGAGEMFSVSTLDKKNIPLLENGEIDYKQDFFEKETNLTVSGQLEGEAAAMGLGRIYTFGPTFRAENSNTSRHLAEFWMVEPEMAFCDLSQNMNISEEFLKYIISYVLENCKDDLEFLNQRFEKENSQKPKLERADMSLLEKLNFVVENQFVKLSYTEAIDILRNSKPNKKKKFKYLVNEWGVDLQSEHERFLVEKHFKSPVIIFDYPSNIKAFYMRENDDKKTVRAMDVLFPGIGEIIGGSQREERLDVLKEKMSTFDIDEKELWWYLDTRRFGTVTHSGFGLGLERLVMFVTGMSNIRDVIPFPRTPKNAEF